MQMNELYEKDIVVGWPGEKIARQEFNMLKDSDTFKTFSLSLPSKGSRRSKLIECARAALGRDIAVRVQTIGECVSMMAVNSAEYLMTADIILRKDAEKYRRLFSPYPYGTGRILVGGGRLGNSDGSTGGWMSEAAVKYGYICEDDPEVPQYSASVAKQFGSNKNLVNKFVELGKQHVVKSATPCRDWETLVTGLCNGYVCGVCSNRGFSMQVDSTGFHRAQGTWNHAMTIIQVDDDWTTPHGIILNSWDDVHGHLKDFSTSIDLPVGCIRAKKNVIEAMLAQGDSYLYSVDFQGFPDQQEKIEKALFKMI